MAGGSSQGLRRELHVARIEATSGEVPRLVARRRIGLHDPDSQGLLGGAPAALVGTAVLLLVIVAVVRRSLRSIDGATDVPQVHAARAASDMVSQRPGELEAL